MLEKQTKKLTEETKSFFSGTDGSVFDVLGKTILFIKEVFESFNESMKNRRYRKEHEQIDSSEG